MSFSNKKNQATVHRKENKFLISYIIIQFSYGTAAAITVKPLKVNKNLLQNILIIIHMWLLFKLLYTVKVPIKKIHLNRPGPLFR